MGRRVCRRDAPQTLEGRAVTGDFAAFEARWDAFSARGAGCPLRFERPEAGEQVILERSTWADLHAQPAARAGFFQNSHALIDAHRVVRAGLHALVAAADRVFFDQTALPGVIGAQVGQVHERI